MASEMWFYGMILKVTRTEPMNNEEFSRKIEIKWTLTRSIRRPLKSLRHIRKVGLENLALISSEAEGNIE